LAGVKTGLLVLLLSMPAFVLAQNPTPAPASISGNPMAALAGMLSAFQTTNSDENGTAGEPADMMAAAAKFIGALQGGTNSPFAAMGAQPAVDFRELRALLPEELAGLQRAHAEGRKTGAFGVNVAEATGEYGEGNGPRLEVKITDLGAMGPAAAMASFGWMATEIDSEGDDGYERTTEYQRRKGLEKYRKIDKTGSAKMMAAGRFMVEISGDNIEPSQLRTAAETIDLGALERLGNRPKIE
jgi:hypothetical protein